MFYIQPQKLGFFIYLNTTRFEVPYYKSVINILLPGHYYITCYVLYYMFYCSDVVITLCNTTSCAMRSETGGGVDL